MTNETWLNIEVRPGAAPTIERNPNDGTYLLEWEGAGLAVMLSADELAALVTEAMIARADVASRLGRTDHHGRSAP
jgi:hypothetical protein